MAQNSLTFPVSSPPAYPGTALTSGLNAAFQTVATLQQGSGAPTSGALGFSPLAGVLWHNILGTSVSGSLNIRNQADTAWILLGTLFEASSGFVPAPQVNILSVTGNYTTSGAHAQLEVNAASGAVTITFPISLGASGNSPQIRVIKTDTSTNPVSISNGSGVVDQIVTAATASGKIGGWRDVYSNGTALRTAGVG